MCIQIYIYIYIYIFQAICFYLKVLGLIKKVSYVKKSPDFCDFVILICVCVPMYIYACMCVCVCARANVRACAYVHGNIFVYLQIKSK
jgi:hypothetical protein